MSFPEDWCLTRVSDVLNYSKTESNPAQEFQKEILSEMQLRYMDCKADELVFFSSSVLSYLHNEAQKVTYPLETIFQDLTTLLHRSLNASYTFGRHLPKMIGSIPTEEVNESSQNFEIMNILALIKQETKADINYLLQLFLEKVENIKTLHIPSVTRISCLKSFRLLQILFDEENIEEDLRLRLLLVKLSFVIQGESMAGVVLMMCNHLSSRHLNTPYSPVPKMIAPIHQQIQIDDHLIKSCKVSFYNSNTVQCLSYGQNFILWSKRKLLELKMKGLMRTRVCISSERPFDASSESTLLRVTPEEILLIAPFSASRSFDYKTSQFLFRRISYQDTKSSLHTCRIILKFPKKMTTSNPYIRFTIYDDTLICLLCYKLNTCIASVGCISHESIYSLFTRDQISMEFQTNKVLRRTPCFSSSRSCLLFTKDFNIRFGQFHLKPSFHPFTIELWFFPLSTDNNQMLFLHGEKTKDEIFIELQITGDAIEIRGGSWTPRLGFSGVVYKIAGIYSFLRKWWHVTLVFSGTFWELWIYEKLESRRPALVNPQAIQQSFCSIGRNFTGYLAEIRVWQTKRSGAEIRRDLYRSLQGNEPFLHGYFPLDEQHGCFFSDYSEAPGHYSVHPSEEPQWIPVSGFPVSSLKIPRVLEDICHWPGFDNWLFFTSSATHYAVAMPIDDAHHGVLFIYDQQTLLLCSQILFSIPYSYRLKGIIYQEGRNNVLCYATKDGKNTKIFFWEIAPRVQFQLFPECSHFDSIWDCGRHILSICANEAKMILSSEQQIMRQYCNLADIYSPLIIDPIASSLSYLLELAVHALEKSETLVAESACYLISANISVWLQKDIFVLQNIFGPPYETIIPQELLDSQFIQDGVSPFRKSPRQLLEELVFSDMVQHTSILQHSLPCLFGNEALISHIINHSNQMPEQNRAQKLYNSILDHYSSLHRMELLLRDYSNIVPNLCGTLFREAKYRFSKQLETCSSEYIKGDLKANVVNSIDDRDDSIATCLEILQERLFALAIDQKLDGFSDLIDKYSNQLLLISKESLQMVLEKVQKERNFASKSDSLVSKSFFGYLLPWLTVVLPLLPTCILYSMFDNLAACRDVIMTLVEFIPHDKHWLRTLRQSMTYALSYLGCNIGSSKDFPNMSVADMFQDLLRGGRRKSGTPRDMAICSIISNSGPICEMLTEIRTEFPKFKLFNDNSLEHTELLLMAAFCNILLKTSSLVNPDRNVICVIYGHVYSMRLWILSQRQENLQNLVAIGQRALFLSQLEFYGNRSMLSEAMRSVKALSDEVKHRKQHRKLRKTFQSWRKMRNLKSIVSVLAGRKKTTTNDTVALIIQFLKSSFVDCGAIERIMLFKSDKAEQRRIGLIALWRLVEESRVMRQLPVILQAQMIKTFYNWNYLNNIEGCEKEVLIGLRTVFFQLLNSVCSAYEEQPPGAMKRGWAWIFLAILSSQWKAGDYTKLIPQIPQLLGELWKFENRTYAGISSLNGILPVSIREQRIPASGRYRPIIVGSSGLSLRNIGDRGLSITLPCIWHSNQAHKNTYYFEISIIELYGVGGCSLGVAPPNFPPVRAAGCNPGTYALNGEEGILFCESNVGQRTGHIFGPTDVVGCGWRNNGQELFWTKNGKLLPIEVNTTAKELSPLVGIDIHGIIIVNFGAKPFLFDPCKNLPANRIRKHSLGDTAWDVFKSFSINAVSCIKYAPSFTDDSHHFVDSKSFSSTRESSIKSEFQHEKHFAGFNISEFSNQPCLENIIGNSLMVIILEINRTIYLTNTEKYITSLCSLLIIMGKALRNNISSQIEFYTLQASTILYNILKVPSAVQISLSLECTLLHTFYVLMSLVSPEFITLETQESKIRRFRYLPSSNFLLPLLILRPLTPKCFISYLCSLASMNIGYHIDEKSPVSSRESAENHEWSNSMDWVALSLLQNLNSDPTNVWHTSLHEWIISTFQQVPPLIKDLSLVCHILGGAPRLVVPGDIVKLESDLKQPASEARVLSISVSEDVCEVLLDMTNGTKYFSLHSLNFSSIESTFPDSNIPTHSEQVNAIYMYALHQWRAHPSPTSFSHSPLVQTILDARILRILWRCISGNFSPPPSLLLIIAKHLLSLESFLNCEMHVPLSEMTERELVCLGWLLYRKVNRSQSASSSPATTGVANSPTGVNSKFIFQSPSDRFTEAIYPGEALRTFSMLGTEETREMGGELWDRIMRLWMRGFPLMPLTLSADMGQDRRTIPDLRLGNSEDVPGEFSQLTRIEGGGEGDEESRDENDRVDIELPDGGIESISDETHNTENVLTVPPSIYPTELLISTDTLENGLSNEIFSIFSSSQEYLRWCIQECLESGQDHSSPQAYLSWCIQESLEARRRNQERMSQSIEDMFDELGHEDDNGIENHPNDSTQMPFINNTRASVTITANNNGDSINSNNNIIVDNNNTNDSYNSSEEEVSEQEGEEVREEEENIPGDFTLLSSNQYFFNAPYHNFLSHPSFVFSPSYSSFAFFRNHFLNLRVRSMTNNHLSNHRRFSNRFLPQEIESRDEGRYTGMDAILEWGEENGGRTPSTSWGRADPTEKCDIICFFEPNSMVRITSGLTIGSSFTFDFFIRLGNNLLEQYILYYSESSPNSCPLTLRIHHGILYFGWLEEDFVSSVFCQTELSETEILEWTRITCTHYNSKLILFKNGKTCHVLSTVHSVKFLSGELIIGGAPNALNRGFSGTIKNFQIYDNNHHKTNILSSYPSETLISITNFTSVYLESEELSEKAASDVLNPVVFLLGGTSKNLQNISPIPLLLKTTITTVGKLTLLRYVSTDEVPQVNAHQEMDFGHHGDEMNYFSVEEFREFSTISLIWEDLKNMNFEELLRYYRELASHLITFYSVSIFLQLLSKSNLPELDSIPIQSVYYAVRYSVSFTPKTLIPYVTFVFQHLISINPHHSLVTAVMTELQQLVLREEKVFTIESPHPSRSFVNSSHLINAPGQSMYSIYFDQLCSTGSFVITFKSVQDLSHVLAQAPSCSLHPFVLRVPFFIVDTQADGIVSQWGFRFWVVYDNVPQLASSRLLRSLLSTILSNTSAEIPLFFTTRSFIEGLANACLVNSGQTRRLLLSCLIDLLRLPERFQDDPPNLESLNILYHQAECQFRRESATQHYSTFVQVVAEFFTVLQDAERWWFFSARSMWKNSFSNNPEDAKNEKTCSMPILEKIKSNFFKKRALQRDLQKYHGTQDRISLAKLVFPNNLRINPPQDHCTTIDSDKAGGTIAIKVELTAGRWYMEVKFPCSADIYIGITTSAEHTDKDVKICDEHDIWAFNGHHNLILRNQTITPSPSSTFSRKWKKGDIIGVVFDIDEKEMSFFVNNKSQFTLISFDSLNNNDSYITTRHASYNGIGANLNISSEGQQVSCLSPEDIKNLQFSETTLPPSVWNSASFIQYMQHRNFSSKTNSDEQQVEKDSSNIVNSISNASFPSSPISFTTTKRYMPIIILGENVSIRLNLGDAPLHMEIPFNSLPIDSSSLAFGKALPLNQLRAFMDISCALLRGTSLPVFINEEEISATNPTERHGPPHVSIIPEGDAKTYMMEARNNGIAFSTVRANCSVTEGSWYYEVELLSRGHMQVGWIADTEPPGTGVGDSSYSWGLDLFHRVLWQEGRMEVLAAAPRWTVGDIIGCGVDIPANVLFFTWNDCQMCRLPFSAKLHNSSGISALVPAVSLRSGNGCMFNFGTSPFKYKPPGFSALGIPDRWTERIDTYYAILEPQALRYRLNFIRETWKSLVSGLLSSDHTCFSEGNALSESLIVKVAYQDPMNHLSPRFSLLKKLVIAIDDYCKKFNQVIPQFTEEQFKKMCAEAFINATWEDLIHLNALARVAKKALPLIYHNGIANNLSSEILRACRSLLFRTIREKMINNILRETSYRSEIYRISINRLKAQLNPHDISFSVFGQTYDLLNQQYYGMFKNSKRFWIVHFLGEGAEDVGGPYREHLSAICQELMSTKLPLFIPTANNLHNAGIYREAFIPSPSAKCEQYLSMFLFIGKLIGGALRNLEPLGFFFPPLVWKYLVGDCICESDLDGIDRMCLNCIREFREIVHKQDITPEIFNETFDTEVFAALLSDGSTQELLPNGQSTHVTYERCAEYADLLAHARLTESFVQLQKMREGLLYVVPNSVLVLLTPEELELRVCGLPDYDVAELRSMTSYEGLCGDERRVLLLWRTLEDATPKQRRLFLRFVSGRERMPVRLRLLPLEVAGNSDSMLPRATTCFFALELPDYTSLEIMKEKIYYVIENCIDIDMDFVVDNIEFEESPQLIVGIDDIRQEPGENTTDRYEI